MVIAGLVFLVLAVTPYEMHEGQGRKDTQAACALGPKSQADGLDLPVKIWRNLFL